MDYWQETIEIAFDEAGIAATKEQIAVVAASIDAARENYSMSMGYDAIPNPIVQENKKLRRDLEQEQRKVGCRECNGRGFVTYGNSIRSTTSQCPKCRGEGKHL